MYTVLDVPYSTLELEGSQGLGSKVHDRSLGLEVRQTRPLSSRPQHLEQGLGFRVEGSGFRVQG